jgi:hypothetical protein
MLRSIIAIVRRQRESATAKQGMNVMYELAARKKAFVGRYPNALAKNGRKLPGNKLPKFTTRI